MKRITYTRLLNETLHLYEKEGSLQAYQFVSKYAGEVEGNQAQIYNFRYSLASASGMVETAMDIMREAIVGKGYWYDPEYLMADDDLKALHQNPEFQIFMRICKNRKDDAKAESYPKLKVIGMDLMKDETKPLLMALHGNQENIKLTEEYWKSAEQEGYMIALPQSSQIEFSDAYVWEDVEKGAREIESHLRELEIYENVDIGKMIIGGFSAGCGTALKAVLDQRISVKGLIFVAPWLPDLQQWENQLHVLKERNVRVNLICGNQDEDCFGGSSRFAEMLQTCGVSYDFEIVEGLDHDYPEHFTVYLKKVMKKFERKRHS